MPGSRVELRRGEHVIVARVMWRDGSRLGLQTDDRVPVEEIMSAGLAKSVQLVASEGSLIERRKRPRQDPDRARSQGRLLEFTVAIATAAIIVGCGWGIVHQALAKPLATVHATLG